MLLLRQTRLVRNMMKAPVVKKRKKKVAKQRDKQQRWRGYVEGSAYRHRSHATSERNLRAHGAWSGAESQFDGAEVVG